MGRGAGRVVGRSRPLPPRRRRRSSRSAGSRTRRRSARSPTRTRRATGSGRSTTTCSSTSAPTTSARRRASPRAGTISDDKKTDHLPPRRGPQVVGRRAGHERGRQVQPRGARRQRPAVHQLHRERHVDRDAGRHHGDRPHEEARHADRRRHLRLDHPRAHLGQADGQAADGLLPADAADRRQRARTWSPSSTPTGSCGWSATRTSAASSRRSTSSSGSSTAAPTPSSAR